MSGNLRLYRWDDDVNGTCQWVPEWAAVSNPCDIAGSCAAKYDNNHRNSIASKLKMSIVHQTNAVMLVYQTVIVLLPCWLLNNLEFGGFEDTSSTLFVKLGPKGSPEGNATGSGDSSDGLRDKVLVLPIVLSMTVLVGLLCLLLCHSVYRRRALKRALESSLIVFGAPMNLSYRDLQRRTGNLHRVWECIQDETLVAVKKLDKPLGKKEFITEVNTIGSMHRMNLVRLCGYCSEGSHQLLVYEFMKNGFLDKWIFPSKHCRDRLLDWGTRFHIAIATAQGIAYFHEQCRNRIIHCDIKPENILLDESFCPKVSDFGLAKLMGREH
ncbi:G-type lectin S-receptor-like serine/threonine-protein kinase [Vitis vinifera]|uniref:G-type lectin S-receptor-like serine/threonine-protein kinase n=1 Tax=Vitis vinifera TaxID=29760 RepID=A0A438IE31_VITVI|nr:G-type lectin S-receptor-like serine/threonine-protein kinase [Vitis vinifera]